MEGGRFVNLGLGLALNQDQVSCKTKVLLMPTIHNELEASRITDGETNLHYDFEVILNHFKQHSAIAYNF